MPGVFFKFLRKFEFSDFFLSRTRKNKFRFVNLCYPWGAKRSPQKFRQLGLAVRPAIDNNKICTPIYTNIFRYKSNLFISSVVVCIRIYIFLV